MWLQALHQLEEELNVKILPGTEIMLDVGSHPFVKSSASSDRVLVPQPSDDPHDPLVSPHTHSDCTNEHEGCKNGISFSF